MSSALKRKRAEATSGGLTEQEKIVYTLIKDTENSGIWLKNIKQGTNLPDPVVNKSIKSLLAKNKIKEVVSVRNKGKKTFMAVEFEPSDELTGGDWYENGNLDMVFINFVKEQCLKMINQLKVATLESLVDGIKATGVFKVDLKKQQFEEILRALVLENAVMEVKSNGMGEFAAITVGKVCYKAAGKRRGEAAAKPRIGAMASIPCGVCPRISTCTPDGVISPSTCVYYQKWLEF